CLARLSLSQRANAAAPASSAQTMARCQQLLGHALSGPSPVAMYVGGALIAIGLAGSMITWGQGLKGQRGIEEQQVPKSQRAIQVPRARFRAFGSFAPTVTRPAAACNAARARCF